MARKNYSEEFRRQAVDLYESSPGATVRGIAVDLGIERGTLRHWLDQYGTGKKTAADGTLTRSPLQFRPLPAGEPLDETPEQQVARLAARVADHRRAERRRERGRAGQPQPRRAGHARGADPRLPAPTPGAHHDPGASRAAGADLLQWDFTAPAPNQRYVGDITYLPIADGQPVPGYRDRLPLPAAGRLVGRRPHAHRAGQDACRPPRQPAAASPGRSSTATTVGQANSRGRRNTLMTEVLCDGGTTGQDAGSGRGSGVASGDAFSGRPEPSRQVRAGVLAADRGGVTQRGRGAGGGCVDAGRGRGGSPRWWDVADQSGRALGPLPVFAEREEIALLKAQDHGSA